MIFVLLLTELSVHAMVYSLLSVIFECFFFYLVGLFLNFFFFSVFKSLSHGVEFQPVRKDLSSLVTEQGFPRND